MSTLPAYIEHGKWKVDCPVCGRGIRVDMATSKAVCKFCYPELLAVAFQPPEGTMDYFAALARSERGLQKPDGVWRKVPDTERRAEGLMKAQESGNIHRAAYPKNKSAIEAVLRQRPRAMNMNWYYKGHYKLLAFQMDEETLADLVADNLRHGVPSGLEA